MICLQQVAKTFHPGTVNQVNALRPITLDVAEGDFITLIGGNGAGKTTLFNLIAGSFLPSQGTIRINDRNVTNEPEYRRARYIGRIFQDPLLGTAGSMTLEDNMMICYRKGMRGFRISLNRERRSFFRDQLVNLRMGLEDRMKDNVRLLSGGQRQALTLLMMVLSRPDLILLDEHTAALDPRNADLVLELTRRYIEDYGLTAMMITHNMQQAITCGNRLLMMDQGEIILDLRGDEKRNLTVEGLVERFHQIRHRDLESDRARLS
ncbi:putative ABC transport system ATP-binding protein [Alkalispirochaeta americana]|uniref:Putative ABC transport system ATP-binding protein n=1 Tax=Alkalispirochaeta americana TaxID=159291 RepID=A0A1N6TYY0_9SPIO|nr:ATP-binding cassette domain-containing protein [Alkalispirochaeta americana]SIQ58451.1 putative ABC transport system ATP-binding protein [Alkalispirochaeta americana]